MAICSVAGLAAAAAIMLSAADQERRAFEEQARALARSTAYAAEREIATTFARLEGLSGAPALRDGDLPALWEQLRRTPSPPGAWFVVADHTGHVLNSLVPPGDPRLVRGSGPGMITARVVLDENRRHVGGALWGPVARIFSVALGIPVTLGPDGRRGALMAALPAARMLALLREQPLPQGWRVTLLDQFSKVVARTDPEIVLGGDVAPQPWQPPHAGEGQGDLLTGQDAAGRPILVARARSDALGWTAVVEVPLSVLQEPRGRAVMRILLAAAGLLVVGLAGAWWLKARIEGSVTALAHAADAAGERQRESEARFRHYWDHTPESLFTVRVTPEGDFVFEGLNPAHEAATGLRLADIMGKRPEECLAPDAAAAVRGRYARCVVLGAPQRYLESLELPAGHRDWETILAPMRDPRTGRISLLIGTSRDVTDRLRAEEALRLNEERLRLALRAADAGTWERDLSRGTMHWSPELFDLLGREPATLHGCDPWTALTAMIHPADRRHVEEHLDAAAADGSLISVEFRLAPEAPDGETRWLVARGRVIRQDGAAATGDRFLGVMVDVTERRRAEAAARSSLALLQRTLDALSVQVAILDAGGVVIAVNAAWSRYVGGVGPTYGSVPGSDYLAACDAHGAVSAIAGRIADGARAVATGSIRDFRDEYRSEAITDAEDRWFQLRITRFGTGTHLRLVVACEEITEIRRSAEGLRVLTGRLLSLQDEERRRIARDLHDSTLQDLAAAKIALDVSLGGADMPAAALEEAGAMLGKAIRDVRTLSYVLHPPLLDECGLAPALEAYVEGFAKRSGLRCSLDLDEAAARLVQPSAGVALFRVAQEAFANAHRHGDARVMHVSLEARDGTVELLVRDDGRGFDPARSGAGAATGEYRMLGVGIPGMRARLNQLGGTLRIESGPTGTTVIARLPLGRPDGRPPRAATDDPAPHPSAAEPITT